MEYLFSPAGNYEDYSSGRVLYGGRGIPNFPVRLINEIFGRALNRLDKKDHIIVYDPCCGGAYSLTIIGFFYSQVIGKIYASDISPEMTAYARKNLGLLKYSGLDNRLSELKKAYEEFGKDSHREAIESVGRLREALTHEVESEVFEADCTKALPDIKPDIIITDIPYGNLVEWEGEGALQGMSEQLLKISTDETVFAVSMDKSQKMNCEGWKRMEKQNIGKRRFELYRKEK